MEMITLAVLGVLSVVGAAFSRVLADECKAWSPWLVDRLIRRAVRKLPADMRERFQEEWQSHVQEIPGEIGKLVTAIGFQGAANKLSGATSYIARINAAIALVMILPLMAAIIVLIWNEKPGDILKRVKADENRHDSKDGYITVFRTTGRIGANVKRYRYDELPHLLDIMRGRAGAKKPFMKICDYWIAEWKRKFNR